MTTPITCCKTPSCCKPLINSAVYPARFLRLPKDGRGHDYDSFPQIPVLGFGVFVYTACVFKTWVYPHFAMVFALREEKHGVPVGVASGDVGVPYLVVSSGIYVRTVELA